MAHPALPAHPPEDRPVHVPLIVGRVIPDTGGTVDAPPQPPPIYRTTTRPNGHGVVLYGGPVADPEQIAAIRRRVMAGVAEDRRRQNAAWRRVLRKIRDAVR